MEQQCCQVGRLRCLLRPLLHELMQSSEEVCNKVLLGDLATHYARQMHSIKSNLNTTLARAHFSQTKPTWMDLLSHRRVTA